MLRSLSPMPALFAPIALMAACSSASEPELLVPDAVSVDWSDAYDGASDGLGAIVPVDVMVYESQTGAPLADVELTITVEHDGTWILPEGTAVRSLRHIEGLEGPERDEPGASQLLWDARHDRYVALDASSAELQVGTASFTTDADGVARVQLFVDRFPADPGLRGSSAFADVAVVISASSPGELLEGTVLLQPR